ncbi:unnamed protein product [Strongylus vulgaris]|uniref:Uncharacterized protein n=1 Tax=Strongylus vulgaris TaxID=40348 RepID=A0A3P7J212_STRVU|nr:unnamed protein product [Strongylus vulgaris]
MDSPETPEELGSPVPKDHPEAMDSLAVQETLAVQENEGKEPLLANAVSAPNTAPTTGEFSSRMELAVKLHLLDIWSFANDKSFNNITLPQDIRILHFRKRDLGRLV